MVFYIFKETISAEIVVFTKCRGPQKHLATILDLKKLDGYFSRYI